MQRNYLQVKQFLEQNFPELEGNISGGNRPPPQFVTVLLNIISVVQLFALACVIIGDSIWYRIPFINGPPSWYKNAKEYPMQTLLFLFLFIPSIVNSFAVSGAFEIMLDENVVFSRLATNSFPNGQQLMDIFTNAGLSRR